LTNRQLSHQELADILRVALRLGLLMLQSGAATFRTDEAVERAALAMGAERIECLVTPTMIIATVYSGHEHRTQIIKPTGLGVDMNRIYALEYLSRNMPPDPTPERITARLDEIAHLGPVYPRPLAILAVGLACGGFAGILGGGPVDFAAATISAAIGQAIRYRLIAARINPILITVICAAVATAVSYLIIRVTPDASRIGIIASVLYLVPGVPLVTSILDMTRFDLVSGLSRALFATLLMISIAIGMLLILSWTRFSIF
jgi:uncharacterized membrane protein YjjP (DUF1212 family)